MDHNFISLQNQSVTGKKLGIFSNLFSEFKIGSLLNRSGISKTKGATPLAVFTIIFNLAFTGKNFFQGIVKNKNVSIGKDAVYNFLNSPKYNWRRFTLVLSNKIYILMRNLLDDSSEEVLIHDVPPMKETGLKKWNCFPVPFIITPKHISKASEC